MSPETLHAAARKTRQRLGSEVDALRRFSPDVRSWCVAERPEVFTDKGGVPTLVVWAEAYGERSARRWIQTQLVDLCLKMGWMDTLTQQEQRVQEERLGRVAGGIVRSYGWLRLSEVMFFLNALQDGQLGEAFMLRNVDKVTDMLRRFLPRIYDLRARHYDEEARQRRLREAEERALQAVTKDEWAIERLLAGEMPDMLQNPLLTSPMERERILVEYRRRWWKRRGVDNPTWEQLHPRGREADEQSTNSHNSNNDDSK